MGGYILVKRMNKRTQKAHRDLVGAGFRLDSADDAAARPDQHAHLLRVNRHDADARGAVRQRAPGRRPAPQPQRSKRLACAGTCLTIPLKLYGQTAILGCYPQHIPTDEEVVKDIVTTWCIALQLVIGDSSRTYPSAHCRPIDNVKDDVHTLCMNMCSQLWKSLIEGLGTVVSYRPNST